MKTKTFTVGQVNNYIKNIISQDYMLKSLAVSGEVSNCKYHSMGHIYFSLKDETGTLPAVMFKGSIASGLDFKLENGQSVTVTGSMNVYERDGRYQLYAYSIKKNGSGRLYEEYERLKYKLNEEGLFDFEFKKPIPSYSKKIGIVTAKTGAAIQDIINVARRRNPYVQLILYPAKVQGEGAADTIVKGIEVLDKMGLDTIIIGRGGGSMEDLWAFNEEKVVRAVFAAQTPIISGTGHEIDITLADYAADMRAPTPSAACELAVFDVMSVLGQLSTCKAGLDRMIMNRLSLAEAKLESYQRRLMLVNPVSKLQQQTQYLADLYDNMNRLVMHKYELSMHRLDVLTARLHGLSPTAKLVGGFGYIECDGKPVNSVKELHANDKLLITLHDGNINTVVTEVKEEDE